METEITVFQFACMVFVLAVNAVVAAALFGLFVAKILIPVAIDVARWVRRHWVVFAAAGLLLGSAATTAGVITYLGEDVYVALTLVFLLECKRRKRLLVKETVALAARVARRNW